MKPVVHSQPEPRTRIDKWLKALRIQAEKLEDLAIKMADTGETGGSQRTCDS
jgi:ribosomal 50S subunit-recycling heat shock protein